MSNPTPPPLSNGHTPVQGEGIRQVVIRSARGQDFQSEAAEFLYEFPTPVSESEALPVVSALQDLAGESAQAKLDAVLAAKIGARAEAVAAAQAAIDAPQEQASPAPAPEGQPPFQPQGLKRPPSVAAQPTPQATPQQVQQAVDNVQAEFPQAQQVPTQGNGPQWQWADKPNGKGSVRYLPESVCSEMDMVNGAKDVLLNEHGIPGSEVVVWDNRDRLREGKGYSAGSIKPRNDSFLQEVIGDEYLGDVEWHDNGTIKVYLNAHGKEAKTAVKVARQQQTASTPL